MPRPPSTKRAPEAAQLDLPQPPASPAAKPRARVPVRDPAELARIAVRKSYRPGASGRLRVPLTLFLDRAVIERLHERAIRHETSVEALVEGILERS